MSFVTPYQTEHFLVDRVTTHGRLVRRVIAVCSDGTVLLCKPSGAVCRVMHAGNVAAMLVAPWERVSSVGVLLRFEREPDLLFRHVMPPRGGGGGGGAGGFHQPTATGPFGGPSLPSADGTSALMGYGSDGLVDTRFGAGALHAYGHSSSRQQHRQSPPPPAVDFVRASALLQTAHRFVQCMALLRGNAGVATDVSTRASLEELVAAADLQRCTAGRRKPEFVPITGTMLLPTIFDPFPIRHNGGVGADKASPLLAAGAGGGGGANAAGNAVPEALDMFVDTSFLTLLAHAVERSPLAGTTSPLVTVEAPDPFRSVVVNDKFFEAFTAAYVANVSLVINAHGPLPHLVSFRATAAFWQFVRKRNGVARPAPSALTALLKDHVEVYIAGDEAATTLSLPLVAWNQTIVDWELQVRSRIDAADDAARSAASVGGGGGGAADGGADEAVWASFIDEAHAAMMAFNKGLLVPRPHAADGLNGFENYNTHGATHQQRQRGIGSSFMGMPQGRFGAAGGGRGGALPPSLSPHSAIDRQLYDEL